MAFVSKELPLLFLPVLPELLIFSCMFLINIKVESALRHGAVLLTWSSFLLDKFFQNVDTALFELKHLVKKVCYWIKKPKQMLTLSPFHVWILLLWICNVKTLLLTLKSSVSNTLSHFNPQESHKSTITQGQCFQVLYILYIYLFYRCRIYIRYTLMMFLKTSQRVC